MVAVHVCPIRLIDAEKSIVALHFLNHIIRDISPVFACGHPGNLHG
jgi:hypothetical protein